MNIEALIHFYETLTPASVRRFAEFYAADAWFKDPFNEVRGLAAIERVFTHMFEQVAAPRFKVVERIADARGTALVWEFHFAICVCGSQRAQLMRGISHLRFDADGKVNYHRDYWDTGEELYRKLPAIGLLIRAMRRMLSS